MNAIEIALAANVPVSIIDNPGSGKTSYLRDLVAAFGGHRELITLSHMLPEDFGFEPDVSSGVYRVRHPRWATRIVELPENIIPVLVIDELTSASTALQSPAMRVCLDREVGNDLTLPERTRRVAIWNPPNTSCGGHELSAPMANRFVHLLFSSCGPDDDAWRTGLVSNFANMTSLRAEHFDLPVNEAASRALVASFHRKNVKAKDVDWNKIDPDFPAYPTRRSWTMAARLDAYCDVLGGGQDARIQLISGCVGHGVAEEFLTFRKRQDLPDPFELLKRPERFAVPEHSDVIYTVVAAIVGAALSDIAAFWIPAWKCIEKVSEAGANDIAGLAARQLAKGSEHVRKEDLKNGIDFEHSRCSYKPLLKSKLMPLLKASGVVPA